MVTKVTEVYIKQKCEICKKVRKILIDSLLSGLETDPNIIMLPKCTCGAQEFLNKTEYNPGSHSKLVNKLHKKLKKRE